MRNVLATRLPLLFLPLLVGSFGALACSGGASSGTSTGATSGDLGGRAIAELTSVPVDVFCVEIDVAGARTVSDRFDVTPNQTAVLSLTGLPLGNVTFTGLAYPVPCSAVTSAVQATWISPATPAVLASETVAEVSLALVPNGQASVNVGFNPDDAGSDAAIDAGPAYSFTNPAPIVLPFNADTVATVADSTVTTIDGTSHALFTEGFGVLETSNYPVGLPDGANFGPLGTTMPAVTLGWGSGVGLPNTLLLSTATPGNVTFPVPTGQFSHLQIYAFSTDGPSTLEFTLIYASGGTLTGTMAVPDWCVPGDAGANVLIFDNVNRLVVGATGDTFDTQYLCNIYALDLQPDPTQTLTSVSLAPGGGGDATAHFVAYGGAAW